MLRNIDLGYLCPNKASSAEVEHSTISVCRILQNAVWHCSQIFQRYYGKSGSFKIIFREPSYPQSQACNSLKINIARALNILVSFISLFFRTCFLLTLRDIYKCLHSCRPRFGLRSTWRNPGNGNPSALLICVRPKLWVFECFLLFLFCSRQRGNLSSESVAEFTSF